MSCWMILISQKTMSLMPKLRIFFNPKSPF
ncbi:Uncharacterised protein [Vibrio cholerae]|nr:Uncharacterised protein [Vibrio cholerae]CSI86277.1 Uncharacterised protein [Vibrio cholerae]